MATKQEIVTELEGLVAAGITVEPFKMNQKKDLLEEILAKAREKASTLTESPGESEEAASPETGTDDDKSAAQVPETEGPAESDASPTEPVEKHPDACATWAQHNIDSGECKMCANDFPECHAVCIVATQQAQAAAQAKAEAAPSGIPRGSRGRGLKSMTNFEDLQKFLLQDLKNLNTTLIFDRLCLRGGQLSTILAQFKAIRVGRGYEAFKTLSYAKNHIKYRMESAGWVYDVKPDMQVKDPVVKLIDVRKAE